jgi:hypothetical protein
MGDTFEKGRPASATIRLPAAAPFADVLEALGRDDVTIAVIAEDGGTTGHIDRGSIIRHLGGAGHSAA